MVALPQLETLHRESSWLWPGVVVPLPVGSKVSERSGNVGERFFLAFKYIYVCLVDCLNICSTSFPIQCLFYKRHC